MPYRALKPILAAVAALALAGAAQGEDPSGYLSKDRVPDAVRILPPPPAAGSGRAADDSALFAATRKLQGAPRWDLATSDADLRLEHVMDDFSCAVGFRLDPAGAPALAHVLRRLEPDVGAVVNPAKEHYARPRPYLAAAGDPPVCVPKSDMLAHNYAYPSGHATISWAWGLVLAELAPERATEILTRARVIGESRAICGVHYLSDIEAGRTAGAALVAALHGDETFRADMDKARAEMASFRALGRIPNAQACAARLAGDQQLPY